MHHLVRSRIFALGHGPIPGWESSKDEWRQHMFMNSTSPNLGRDSKRDHDS